MKKFLITGGQERKGNVEYEGWRGSCAGKLLRVDFDTGKTEELVVLDQGGDNYPDDNPNLLFTAATLDGDTLWLCSETEAFEYSYPQLELKRKASYPCFQNIHHVATYGENIAVVSTGLDMVVLLSKETLEPVSYINVEGKDAWHRFSCDVDYRKIHSTKPHDSHPNLVFNLDGDLWATRFIQRDAVMLGNASCKISVSDKCGIHDGHVVGGEIYFTSVNGAVIIVDLAERKVKERISLREIEGVSIPLAWCRGLHIDGDIAYVGFSHLRPTKLMDNIRWARNYVASKGALTKTRIVAYDLKKKKKVGECFMPKNSVSSIYSIIGVQ